MDDAMNDSKMIRAIAARFVSMLSNLSPCDNATNEFRTNDATPISTENGKRNRMSLSLVTSAWCSGAIY